MPHDELIERLRRKLGKPNNLAVLCDEAAEALTTMQAREATLIRALERIVERLDGSAEEMSEDFDVMVDKALAIATEALGTSGLVP